MSDCDGRRGQRLEKTDRQIHDGRLQHAEQGLSQAGDADTGRLKTIISVFRWPFVLRTEDGGNDVIGHIGKTEQTSRLTVHFQTGGRLKDIIRKN